MKIDEKAEIYVTRFLYFFHKELEKEHWGDIDPDWFTEPKPDEIEQVADNLSSLDCYKSLRKCVDNTFKSMGIIE